MKRAAALRQLGDTQQKLLRKLLVSPQGATVEALCQAVGITHNAVRQHLTALMAQGLVSRGEAIPSGGRPRACFVLTPAGRELFPRNYALMAGGMLEYLYAHGVVAADAWSRRGESGSQVLEPRLEGSLVKRLRRRIEERPVTY